jgi:hypothetical protein
LRSCLLREVLNKRIELSTQARFSIPLPVQIVEQLVHEDKRRLALGQKLPDHLCGRCDALRVVLSNDGEALFAA